MEQFKDSMCLFSLLPKGNASLAIDCDPNFSQVLPTGSQRLDMITGFNGYPVGKITEIFGKESSWKTTLALHAVVEAQKLGGVVVWLDIECSFDAGYAKRIGVDLSRVILLRPGSAEEAIDGMVIAAESSPTRLIVVDSIAAMVTKNERENSVELMDRTTLPEVLARGLPKLLMPCKKNGCTVLLLNQIRYRSGTFFGAPYVTPGGQALRHYTSLRIQTGVAVGAQLPILEGYCDASEQIRRTGARVVKSKAVHFPAPCSLYFNKHGRLDVFLDLLLCAAELGLLRRQNGNLYFNEWGLGLSFEASQETAIPQPDLIQKLQEAIQSDLKLKQVSDSSYSPQEATISAKPPGREIRTSISRNGRAKSALL